jgi:hypothetical protein
MLRDTLPAAMIATACAVATAVLAGRTPPDTAIRRDDAGAPAPLLDGLRVGDRIAGWTVTGIDPTQDGGLDVTVAREGMAFALAVVPLGVRRENPPYAGDTHAIYYGHARPAGMQIPAGALRAITADLLRRLDRAAR